MKGARADYGWRLKSGVETPRTRRGKLAVLTRFNTLTREAYFSISTGLVEIHSNASERLASIRLLGNDHSAD
jgi:hypothetical protein